MACWSPIDFARAFFGCLAAGIVPVPVNPALRSTTEALSGLAAIAEDAKPISIIGDRSVLTAIRKANRQFEQGPTACHLFTPAELIAQGADSRFDTIQASRRILRSSNTPRAPLRRREA